MVILEYPYVRTLYLLFLQNRFGESNFEEANKLVNTIHSTKVDWTKFRYMAFDLPNHRGSYRERYAELGIFSFPIKPFSYKYQKVNRLRNKEGKYVHIAGTETCNGMDHLEKFFQDIIDRGGEGIILRDPDSPFQHGRSSGYLKHKVSSITLAETPVHTTTYY